MSDDSLSRIQAKIAQLEAQLSDLKTTEREVQKLSGASTRRPIDSTPAKRSAKIVEDTEESPAPAPTGSVIGRIKDYLKANGPSSATAIAEGIGVENRPVSFALQALKKQGKAKLVGREWATARRRAA